MRKGPNHHVQWQASEEDNEEIHAKAGTAHEVLQTPFKVQMQQMYISANQTASSIRNKTFYLHGISTSLS